MSRQEVVLDSYAVLVYLKRQRGMDAVSALLIKGNKEDNLPLLSLISWGEVLYITEREEGEHRAKLAEEAMAGLNLRIVDVNAGIIRQAARYKAKGKMSYADAITAATAKAHQATLVTGDKEFRPLEKEIKILWL